MRPDRKPDTNNTTYLHVVHTLLLLTVDAHGEVVNYKESSDNEVSSRPVTAALSTAAGRQDGKHSQSTRSFMSWMCGN